MACRLKMISFRILSLRQNITRSTSNTESHRCHMLLLMLGHTVKLFQVMYPSHWPVLTKNFASKKMSETKTRKHLFQFFVASNNLNSSVLNTLSRGTLQRIPLRYLMPLASQMTSILTLWIGQRRMFWLLDWDLVCTFGTHQHPKLPNFLILAQQTESLVYNGQEMEVNLLWEHTQENYSFGIPLNRRWSRPLKVMRDASVVLHGITPSLARGAATRQSSIGIQDALITTLQNSRPIAKKSVG